jgi:glycosyltransferase involved in cell wall biosynthesis
MLLTNTIDESHPGGREQLSSLLYRVLHELLGDQLIVYELHKTSKHTIFSAGRAMLGEIDGLNARTIGHALQLVRDHRVARVFIDGSNFGEFVKIARRQFPQLQISTFFHNVEAMFFLGSLRQARTVRALAVLAANYLAERKSVRHSDQRICMSERDSRLLQKLYGQAATHLLPMAMQDKLPADYEVIADAAQGIADPGSTLPEPYALFVGGNFYANRAGIRWYVEHVVPRTVGKTVIVGRGLDDLRSELELSGRVEVVGAVDQLASWYRNAQFVIAPIFGGSGMKTKVAEALMFGKKIVGTAEAFSGFEDIIGRAGWVCETVEEFVAAIAQAQAAATLSCDPQLRAIYQQCYSYAAARTRLSEILQVTPGAAR